MNPTASFQLTFYKNQIVFTLNNWSIFQLLSIINTINDTEIQESQRLSLEVGKSYNKMSHLQNKIYYIPNPVSAGQTPSTGLRNRREQKFLVELPQGEHYFGPSRKKQYAGIHHHSEIRETGIFKECPRTFEHGTYGVSDIEGAVPDSLRSKAVKNRMKSYLWTHDQSRVKTRVYTQVPNIEDNQYMTQQKQLEDIRNNESNYHYNRITRVHTEPAETVPILQIPSFEFKEQRMATEETQTDLVRLRNLEEELFENQKNRLKYRSETNPSIKTVPHENNLYLRPAFQPQQAEITERKWSQVDENMKTGLGRSKEFIQSMWHGDSHKIKLYAQRDIRRLNPTYLSTQNYTNQSVPVFDSNR